MSMLSAIEDDVSDPDNIFNPDSLQVKFYFLRHLITIIIFFQILYAALFRLDMDSNIFFPCDRLLDIPLGIRSC